MLAIKRNALIRYVVVLALTLSASHNFASTIMQIDMDTMLEQSAMVFEGQVTASQAKWNADNTSIYTEVVFRVDDVIKGDYSESAISLRFAGGVVGDTGLKVSAMVYPKLGERGIYFVESLAKQNINPLMGWSQGHFLIEKDAQQAERITTDNHIPVLGVELGSLLQIPASRNASPEHASSENISGSQIESDDMPISTGAAQGVVLAKRGSAMEQALEKQTFKASLRLRLQELAAEGEQ